MRPSATSLYSSNSSTVSVVSRTQRSEEEAEGGRGEGSDEALVGSAAAGGQVPVGADADGGPRRRDADGDVRSGDDDGRRHHLRAARHRLQRARSSVHAQNISHTNGKSRSVQTRTLVRHSASPLSARKQPSLLSPPLPSPSSTPRSFPLVLPPLPSLRSRPP